MSCKWPLLKDKTSGFAYFTSYSFYSAVSCSIFKDNAITIVWIKGSLRCQGAKGVLECHLNTGEFAAAEESLAQRPPENTLEL